MSVQLKILLFVLTIVVVLLKLGFEYYNLIFPLVLIVVFLIFKKNTIFNTFTFALLTLNLLCLFTSDKFVYRILNNQEYFWSEQNLSISDFKGTPDPEDKMSAKVFPKMIGKVNRVYNYPPAIVFASNESDKSWINLLQFDDTEQDQKELERILIHEKTHLNITEVYVCKAQDSLNKMFFSTPFEKFDVMEYFYLQSDSIQDAFDIETNHSLLKKKNMEWNNFIKSQL